MKFFDFVHGFNVDYEKDTLIHSLENFPKISDELVKKNKQFNVVKLRIYSYLQSHHSSSFDLSSEHGPSELDRLFAVFKTNISFQKRYFQLLNNAIRSHLELIELPKNQYISTQLYEHILVMEQSLRSIHNELGQLLNILDAESSIAQPHDLLKNDVFFDLYLQETAIYTHISMAVADVADAIRQVEDNWDTAIEELKNTDNKDLALSVLVGFAISAVFAGSFVNNLPGPVLALGTVSLITVITAKLYALLKDRSFATATKVIKKDILVFNTALKSATTFNAEWQTFAHFSNAS